MITIAEKRDANIMAKKYPNALIIDVSYSSMRYIGSGERNSYGMLNAFYPHGKIQVPFTDGYTGVSISAIWNSLKVFEDADVDVNLINCEDIHMLRRENLGRLIGFRQGFYNNYIMDVVEARRKILIPMYRWMLEQKTYCIIEHLRKIAQQQDIVILDDSINCDITNINVPLSYAWLIKSYIEGMYPYEDVYEIRKTTDIIQVGQHMYYRSKENRVLKRVTPNIITKQLRIGFNYD